MKKWQNNGSNECSHSMEEEEEEEEEEEPDQWSCTKKKEKAARSLTINYNTFVHLWISIWLMSVNIALFIICVLVCYSLTVTVVVLVSLSLSVSLCVCECDIAKLLACSVNSFSQTLCLLRLVVILLLTMARCEHYLLSLLLFPFRGHWLQDCARQFTVPLQCSCPNCETHEGMYVVSLCVSIWYICTNTNTSNTNSTVSLYWSILS